MAVPRSKVSRMKRAREARGYSANWFWQAASTGPLIATLFIRSLERGERVYLAMAARGYAGAMPQLVPLAFRRADAAFLLVLLLGLLALRVAVELA